VIEVNTREQAARLLQDVLRYVGAYYGGTLAHHIVSLALKEIRGESNLSGRELQKLHNTDSQRKQFQ